MSSWMGQLSCLFIGVALPATATASPSSSFPFLAKHTKVSASMTNDCRILPDGEAKASGQCGAAPNPWDGPTSCCCLDEECAGDLSSYYQSCSKKASNATVIAQMTHYWDCCRPSCAITGEISACDGTGVTPVSKAAAQSSVCDSGASATGASTCKSNIPQIQNGVLYGYGAMTGSTSIDIPCGKCFEVKFSNARGIDKAIIKISNAGNSKEGNIDLLVPGGGFGEFNGCQAAKGWEVYTSDGGPCIGGTDNYDSDNNLLCGVNGGFGYQQYCDSAFPGDTAAATACNDVLWGAFPQVGCNNDAGYPPNLDIVSSTQVDCPSYFE